MSHGFRDARRSVLLLGEYSCSHVRDRSVSDVLERSRSSLWSQLRMSELVDATDQLRRARDSVWCLQELTIRLPERNQFP